MTISLRRHGGVADWNCLKEGQDLVITGKQACTLSPSSRGVQLCSPLRASCNLADGQGTHWHILMHGEVHAAVGCGHELVSVTQLAGDGCSALQADVPIPHACHVFMQP